MIRMLLTGLLLLTAVVWGILGLLLVGAAARSLEWWGTILIMLVWLTGLAGFVGGAVRLMRPALQAMASGLGKNHLETPRKKQT